MPPKSAKIKKLKDSEHVILEEDIERGRNNYEKLKKRYKKSKDVLRKKHENIQKKNLGFGATSSGLTKKIKSFTNNFNEVRTLIKKHDQSDTKTIDEKLNRLMFEITEINNAVGQMKREYDDGMERMNLYKTEANLALTNLVDEIRNRRLASCIAYGQQEFVYDKKSRCFQEPISGFIGNPNKI